MRTGRAAAEVFAAFLMLGFTSFGGPIAHLGYFREAFVQRRHWLRDARFAQIVALCNVLPGPTSSQVGLIIGYGRAGSAGAIAAWCGFTLPSALLLFVFAEALRRTPARLAAGPLHGLAIAAVAIVAIAAAKMASSLAPDVPRRILAFATAIAALLVPANGFTQLALVATGALAGALLRPRVDRDVSEHDGLAGDDPGGISRDEWLGIASAATFAVLVFALPLAARLSHAGPIVAFATFFDVGALVFGGGHVVLPALQAQVVAPGWISRGDFLAGYGAAQAIPGPLYTFASYLGAAMDHGPVHGAIGAAICLVAIFLPSAFLIGAVMPFSARFARLAAAAGPLRGMNAAVVGLLFAALYNPVWVGAIHSPADAALALLALAALTLSRAPPWSVVLGSALGGALLAAVRVL